MEYLKWYNNEQNYIFINNNTLPGRPLHPNTVRDHMREMLEAAELSTNITPHSLRHTYTSLMSEAGVELPVIQQMLGHKNDATTRNIYLHVTEARKRASVEKLDLLMNGLL
ncbi:Tyrosine recombinase XerD [compost metagenome]